MNAAEPERVLEGRIALITGASRGIGYHTAKAMAAAGAHIVAVARTVGGLEELDDEIQSKGGQATLVPLDLKDMEGIDRLGAALNERWGRLDIFHGNGGVLGQLSPLAHVEAKTWDEVMTINVTANWRLIRTLDPLLRKSDAGRVILMSSAAPHKCTAYWGPYSASKAAVEAIARTYAHETLRTPVRVVSVDPGRTRTAMRAKAKPGEDPESLPHPSEVAAELVKLASPGFDRTGVLYRHTDKTFIEYPAYN